MNGSNKQTNAGVEDAEELMTDPLESIACRNLRRELTNLASQMQMMSDSLAACKQMSKGRPLRKMYSVKGNSQAETTAPQASVQVLLSPENRPVDHRADEDQRSVIVSYMVRETQQLQKNDSDEAGSCQQEGCSRRRGSWSSIIELLRGSSKIHMYEHQEVDSSRMVEIIQRELKTLTEVAPSVAELATTLSGTIYHYKECDRCSEKISPCLPWILNRIQKLIKYVTTQKQGTYRWPNDYSYLRLRSTNRTAPHHLLPHVPGRTLAKLEKVDPLSIAEDIPGLQLLLEVEPDITHKKFFEKAENQPVAPRESFLNFPVVQLREPKSVPLVQVLLPADDPAILLDEKREANALREIAYALRLIFVFCRSPLTLLLLSHPVARSNKTRRVGFSFYSKPPHRTNNQELSAHQKKSSSKGPPTGQAKAGEKTARKSESPPRQSNDKNPFPSRDLLVRVPEIVREFLLEAETEKMHDQRVQNLEVGVKGLKDLMTEVQRNQIKLSKVLLEKGVYPQPIIKLTNPDLLGKENEVIRRVAEFQGAGSQGVSVEALQTTVDDVRHKCALKNRMIQVILNGLCSNIPKEWWEDMVEYAFDESKPIEDFDPEKVSEIVRRASGFRGKGEQQESRIQAWALRTELQPSEEESNMKGNVGADVEEYLKKRWKYDGVVAKTKEGSGTSEGFSDRTSGSPAAENPDSVGTSIRKMEHQLSLLNTENERLRLDIEDMKSLLRSSVDGLRDKRVSRIYSDQQSPPRAPGRTINLTIQILDKDFRHMNDSVRLGNVTVADGARSPPVKHRDEDPSDFRESSARKGEHLGHDSTILSEADRERWGADWSCLDDHQGSEKVGSVLRESGLGQSSHRTVHQLAVTSGHPSGQEVCRKLKPIEWVPSKYRIPEVSDGYGAGPSQRPVDVAQLLQKPSLMELIESEGILGSMANERELQTIPENDCSPGSGSSKGISQAIQRLRSRVRSIHKDVTVLKSKNDRIDKLLDRLMDDAVENSESFEEMEKDFHRLKDQLG